MLLHENLKALRKARGLSQEELAVRLHVVRQTVSKWEKELSVPDEDLLIKIAEVFEVPVSKLLGTIPECETGSDNTAAQLSRINEQLAVKNRRARLIWKVAAGVLIAVLLVYILLAIVDTISFARFQTNMDTKHMITTPSVSVFEE